MGASKTDQYTDNTLHLAQIANALGHPARIAIIELLKENPELRMTDFPSILGLSWSTTQRHFKKLNSVQLISYSFLPNEYHLNLKEKRLYELNDFLRK